MVTNQTCKCCKWLLIKPQILWFSGHFTRKSAQKRGLCVCVCACKRTGMQMKQNTHACVHPPPPPPSRAPGPVYCLMFIELLIRGITIMRKLLKTAAVLSISQPPSLAILTPHNTHTHAHTHSKWKSTPQCL